MFCNISIFWLHWIWSIYTSFGCTNPSDRGVKFSGKQRKRKFQLKINQENHLWTMPCNGKGISIWNHCTFVDSFSGEYSLLSSLQLLTRLPVDRLNFSFLWTHFPLIFLSQHLLHIISFMNLYFSLQSMYFSIFDLYRTYYFTTDLLTVALGTNRWCVKSWKSVRFRAFNKLKLN